MRLNPALSSSFPEVSIPFFHQDQVVELPPESMTVASASHCPVAVYRIGRHIISLQGHPEYSDQFSQALYRLRQPEYGAALLDQALASFSRPSGQQQVADWLVRFLKGPVE